LVCLINNLLIHEKNINDIVRAGTYQIGSKETINQILDAALKVGYRLVDTAQLYRNEKQIGSALDQLLPKYGLTRFSYQKLNWHFPILEKCRKFLFKGRLLF